MCSNFGVWKKALCRVYSILQCFNAVKIASFIAVLYVRHNGIFFNIATLQSRYSHFADERTDLEKLSDLFKTTLW